MKTTTKFLLLAFVLASSAAIADPVSDDHQAGVPKVGLGLPPLPEHYWVLTMIMSTGQEDRWAFPTKGGCEAAIPRFEKELHGYNGHCDPSKPPE